MTERLKSYAPAQITKNSYGPRTVRDWNILPANVFSASTLSLFKRAPADRKSF